ncbi:hypothetical protein E4U55_000139 [Claviceps digitariae]|nr:hypothetical protein E4U55_000139 [Claviceps digitariae]
MAADSSSPTKRESTSPTKDQDVNVVNKAAAAAAPDPSSSVRTRLHITPLDQDLLKVVLPASVLPHARNISLHTIETFPENRYGYVDLPVAEAEKLKKRLNGTTFKGVKMRVEKARPEIKRGDLASGEASADDANKDGRRKRKRKAEGEAEAQAQNGSSKHRRDMLNVVEGVLLKDRKVKRGWTESTDTKVKNKRSRDKDRERERLRDEDKDKAKDKQKRKRLKSKYTDQDECLLKTRLPANAVGNIPVGSEAHKTLMMANKKKKNAKNGSARDVIVHEFEKTTTFPSFLKHVVPERQGKEAVEFVDGKGWVDEDGKLVEAVELKHRMERTEQKRTVTNKETTSRESSSSDEDDSDDDSTSSSGTSSSGDSGSDSDNQTSISRTPKAIPAAHSKETRPSNTDPFTTSTTRPSSSSSSSSSSSPSSSPTSHTTPKPQPLSHPLSSSSSRSLTIKIPLPPATPTPAAPRPPLHPLEALYKRPKPDDSSASASASAQTPSFSFFNDAPHQDHMDDDTTPATSVPLTPFTAQDLEWRHVRSAAPTPDTAHPTRGRTFWEPDPEDEEAEEEDEHEHEPDPDPQQNQPELAEMEEKHDEEDHARPHGQQDTSDFQSWFWENRRDLNRAWMTRRKMAGKERRHRENKARASKAI